jgi:hypothetical protein
MFNSFKPTTKEKRAIEGAWRWLAANTRDESCSTSFMKQEHRGYGNANDRVPLIVAKGMCLQWFLQGVNAPEVLLRDCYRMRPAAIWFAGMGAARSGNAPVDMPALQAAVEAYRTAFERMQAEDKGAL